MERKELNIWSAIVVTPVYFTQKAFDFLDSERCRRALSG